MNDKTRAGSKAPENGRELAETAKSLLMHERGMTEQQAHKYLQKQSMDRCIPKSIVAMAVIKELS